MPGLSVPHHLPKFAQVHVHCISDAIQPLMPSHPLRPSSPSALNLFQHQGLFQSVSCQLSASDDQNTGVSTSAPVLSTEYSGLISLKIDWFDLFEVQGTLRSLPHHHSSKVSILQGSASLRFSSHHACPLGRPLP